MLPTGQRIPDQGSIPSNLGAVKPGGAGMRSFFHRWPLGALGPRKKSFFWAQQRAPGPGPFAQGLPGTGQESGR